MVDELSGGRVTHLGIGLTFGLIVAAMIFATGHISGAHINPAVTLAFAISRHFPWKRVPCYILAQLAGAAAAGLTLLAILGDVAHMGATLPTGSDPQALGLEVVLTFFLMFVIMAVATDARAEGNIAAIAIGATVALESTFAGPHRRSLHEPSPLSRPRAGRLDLDQPVAVRHRASGGSSGCVNGLHLAARRRQPQGYPRLV